VPLAFEQLVSWENLWSAWQNAARGKRRSPTVAQYEFKLADNLLGLQARLTEQSYRPGPYHHFFVHQPKTRKVSAAPFEDRIVHHALCQIIEPRFERYFIADSYANRVGKGTHKAVDRFAQFAQSYRYVLRCDIKQYFASIDHQLLIAQLCKYLSEEEIVNLISRIVVSGDRVLEDQYTAVYFTGDDLFDIIRPRGLPIGNLTSQFWSNAYLHQLDVFAKRELGCRGYLRYVDDFALFANDRKTLWQWKSALIGKLAELRLTMHEHSAQVQPTASGSPWLGFVVYPTHRRLKGRKLRHSTRHLNRRYAQWRNGAITFAEFDANVQAWINHARYADSWRLREQILQDFDIRNRFSPLP